MSAPRTRPLRVLHLIDSLERGGIETWLLNMLATIPREECVLDICCKGSKLGSLAQIATGHNAGVHHVALRHRPDAFLRSLSRLIARENYDLLHSHINSHNGLAVGAARMANVPVIATFHNERLIARTRLNELPGISALCQSYCKLSVRYTFKHAQIVAPVSYAVLNSLRKYGDLAESRTRVLYLGAASPRQMADNDVCLLRASLGIDVNTPLMLHVGSFTPQKNHADVLAIFETVKIQRPDVHLILVGDGPRRPFIESEITRKCLRDVHVLGLRNDVTELMAASDVFILPSLHEGLPIVLMEAAAAALPVVASRIPSVAEAIEDGRTGLLAAIGDTHAFSQQVLSVLDNPDLRRELGAAARNYFLHRFSLESSAARLTDLYSQFLIR